MDILRGLVFLQNAGDLYESAMLDFEAGKPAPGDLLSFCVAALIVCWMDRAVGVLLWCTIKKACTWKVTLFSKAFRPIRHSFLELQFS